MKLTKRQKVLLAGFGVALAVFLADRIYPGMGPGRPEEVEASVGMDIGAILPEAATTLLEGTSPEEPMSPRSALAERLEAVGKAYRLGSVNVRDAFHPAQSWIGKPPAKKDEPVRSHEDKAARFIKGHRLQAVVVADSGGSAIINGRYLTIGQKMDGFTLVAVNKNSVVLVCQEARVVLRLTTGAAEGGR